MSQNSTDCGGSPTVVLGWGCIGSGVGGGVGGWGVVLFGGRVGDAVVRWVVVLDEDVGVAEGSAVLVLFS